MTNIEHKSQKSRPRTKSNWDAGSGNVLKSREVSGKHSRTEKQTQQAEHLKALKLKKCYPRKKAISDELYF